MECPKCGSDRIRKKSIRGGRRRIYCNDCKKNSTVALEDDYNGIRDNANKLELDHKDVKHGWLKNKRASVFFKNPEFEQPEFDPDSIDWKELIGDVKLTLIPRSNLKCDEGIFDRLVITDTHIGMTPNADGFSLYGGKWDEEELETRKEIIINTVVSKKRSETLIIDDLGDLMDGWDSKTVRREHHLPQNMDNQKAFDVALKFKISLVSSLMMYYDRVVVHNICNDNHSGAFGYVVNSAFKAVMDNEERVKVVNYRKFINHYRIADNIFILCHGKDDKNLKFGFKPFLDKAQMEKIDNYIDQNYLLQKGVKIEFSKGDSHQLIFDYSSSDRFNYFNYMALSPSSNWIQTNYKKGISGFTFFNYYNTNNCDVKHVFFDWKE